MKDFVDVIGNKAKLDLANSNTYTDANGIVRCSVCNEARVVYIDGIGNMPVTCSCHKREEQEEQRKKLVEEATRKATSFPLFDAHYKEMTFAADDSPNCDASKICRSYTRHWTEMRRENYGLILSGNVGTGKSFYAAAIVNELRSQGVTTMILTTTRFIAGLQSAKDPLKLVQDLNEFCLVALDDLGAERSSDYAVEQLGFFINERALTKKPLIVTTNLTGKNFDNPPDMRFARIFDRVRNLCPYPVILAGESRRKAQRQERKESMAEILNDYE